VLSAGGVNSYEACSVPEVILVMGVEGLKANEEDPMDRVNLAVGITAGIRDRVPEDSSRGSDTEVAR
jgi:hypothetical protein